MVSNPRKTSSQSYVTLNANCLLRNDPSVCPHRGLQPRREIVSASAVPVTV